MRVFPVNTTADDSKWLGWAAQKARALYENAKGVQFKYVMPAADILCKLGRDGAGLYAYVIRLSTAYYPILAQGIGPNTDFRKTRFYIDGYHSGSNVENLYYRGDAAGRTGQVLIASSSGSVSYNGTASPPTLTWVNWPLTPDQNNYVSLLDFPPGADESQWDPWDVFNGVVNGISVPATSSNPGGVGWGYFVGTRSPGAAGRYSDAVEWEKQNNGGGERFAAEELPEDWNALLIASHPSSTDTSEISPVDGETAKVTLFGPDGKTYLDAWDAAADTKIRVFGTMSCAYSAASSAYIFKGWNAATSTEIIRVGRGVRALGVTGSGDPKIVYANGTPLKIVLADTGVAINPVFSDGSPVPVLTDSGTFVTVTTSGAPNTQIGDSVYNVPFHSTSGIHVTADTGGALMWFTEVTLQGVMLEYGGMKYASLTSSMQATNLAISTTATPQLSEARQVIKQVRSLL